MLVKYASNSQILDVKSSQSKVREASLDRYAKDGDFKDYRTDDGYLYVRVRAISSRCNKNWDSWPSDELKKSYASFIGKPVFVDHRNHDPKKARGVVVDAKLHVEDLDKTSSLDSYYSNNPDPLHLPPTWVELLVEVDAKKFPKLAKAIISGDIDSVSMGANVEESQCNICDNRASDPSQYCAHVRNKGAEFDWTDPKTGRKTSKKSYEHCFKFSFFELSFVFDPADETAHHLEVISSVRKEAGVSYLESLLEADDRRIAARHPEGCSCGFCKKVFGDKSEEGSSEGDGESSDGNDAQEKEASQKVGDKKHWIQDAVKKPGELHKDLGVPEGEKIPEEKLEEAEHSKNKKVRERAQFAENVKKGSVKTSCAKCGCDSGKCNGDCDCGPECKVCNKKESHLEAILSADDRRLADTRALPQSELTVAPEKIDTLRQDKICPVCGSEMDEDSCPVCSYEEPPEGFGNPDLTKAQQMDDEQKEQGMEAEDAQDASQMQMQQNPGEQPSPGGAPMPQQQMSSFSFTPNLKGSGYLIVEKTSADLSGGRINTQEKPILPVSRQTTDKPKSQKTISDSLKPVQSNNQKENNNMSTRIADAKPHGGEDTQPDTRVTVTEKGGVGLDPESGIKTVDVMGVGGVEEANWGDRESVDAPLAEDVGPPTMTWHGDAGDSAGQQNPVTDKALSSVHEAADTVPGWKDGLGTVGFETVDLDAPLKEEIGGPTSTFGSDDFHITDPVTNERFEDPAITDHNTQTPDHQPFPPEAEAVKSARLKFHAALKIAEQEIALGMLPESEKHNRMSELEDLSLDALSATEQTIARVKTANLKRTAVRQKTASTGAVPSFQYHHASLERMSSNNNDEGIDIAESIFGG